MLNIRDKKLKFFKESLVFLFLTVILAIMLAFVSHFIQKSEETTFKKLKAEKSLSDLKKAEINKLCYKIKELFKEFNWKIDPCVDTNWEIGGYSVKGNPLIYATYGNPKSKNISLILSAVHADEITPLYIGFMLNHWLSQNIQKEKDAFVVLAPLLNPDGHFRSFKTRTNARKVDCNRNFNTKDWHNNALRIWKTEFKSAKRRYPGPFPASEPETIFQQELIKKYLPQKILSVHAPLSFLDYDGPNGLDRLTLSRFPREYVEKCLDLKKMVKATPGGYFPGSLGNYAGQERGIPTFTLELPTANRKKAEEYWSVFSQGIKTVIFYRVPEIKPPPAG